jgi:hypothetical protein
VSGDARCSLSLVVVLAGLSLTAAILFNVRMIAAARRPRRVASEPLQMTEAIAHEVESWLRDHRD